MTNSPNLANQTYSNIENSDMLNNSENKGILKYLSYFNDFMEELFQKYPLFLYFYTGLTLATIYRLYLSLLAYKKKYFDKPSKKKYSDILNSNSSLGNDNCCMNNDSVSETSV